VIDWLNGRARGFTSPEGDEEVTAFWSSGRVGMTGTSYNGTLPLAAATTGVEGLEAIVPIAPNTSYYHYYRSNGLVRSPGGYLGEDVDVLFDFVNSGEPQRREYCIRTVRDGELAEGQDRASGDYNEFWAGRDYLNAIDGVRAATLLVHGLNDWNVMPEHSVRVYEALRARDVPVQAYFHRGGHGGAPPLEVVNRFFTRFLYGIENGAGQDPRVRIVREGGRDAHATPYADYPNPEARPVVLGLGAGGRGLGALSADAGGGAGVETLVDDVSFGGPALVRAERLEHRLLYATSELAAPVHISGTPRMTVRMASSRPAANLSVWLVALPWIDEADLITRGWADPQNHASMTDGEPLEPGRFYEVSFDLQPDDQIVPAGKRIGLMVFSSDRDFTLWPSAGTELTIDLERTRLLLPVVGGEGAWARASRMGGR
jgi:X-Pro dipeptidyl-peptidase